MRWAIGLLVGLVPLPIAMALPVRALTCNTGPFIVFFEADNAYLSVKAREILDNLTTAATNCGYGRTVVIGHTDTNEEVDLAQKRAEVVRAYLAAHGIPNDDIVTTAVGAERQRIPTGPNVSEPQNRRVEVLVSQP